MSREGDTFHFLFDSLLCWMGQAGPFGIVTTESVDTC